MDDIIHFLLFLQQWVLSSIGQWIPDEEWIHSKCREYPNCDRDNCPFFHPYEKCRRFGTFSCPGIFCRFKHSICPNDQNCSIHFCSFEHKLASIYSFSQSDPLILRVHKEYERRVLFAIALSRFTNQSENDDVSSKEQLKNGPRSQVNAHIREGAICRETSTRNTTVATPTPPSQTSPCDGEEWTVGGKENSPNQQYLRSCKHIRCFFFRQCNDKTCKFAHPYKACRDFPDCPRGRDCAFLHWVCPIDGKCRNEMCPMEHIKQVHPLHISAVTETDAQSHKEYARKRLEEIWKESDAEMIVSPFVHLPSNIEDSSLSCFITPSSG